jgi:hypothetical protein
MRIILATLHWSGSKAELNIWVRYSIPMRGNDLRMMTVIRSYLEDFLEWRLLMIVCMSVQRKRGIVG